MFAECWKYFDPKFEPNENRVITKMAYCKWCPAVYKADSVKNGTGDMNKHYVNCDQNPANEQHNDWVMNKRIINFRPINSHRGVDIGKVLLECINGWGIKNVMTVTVDNIASNDKALEYLLENLPTKYDDGKHFHVRCMAHILNLVVKDGLKAYKKEDTIALAVKYLKHLSQRVTNFKESVENACASNKFLISECPTRWNSTHDMLKTAIELKDAFFDYDFNNSCFARDLEEIPKRADFEIYKVRNKLSGGEDELTKYLKESRLELEDDEDFDILNWWKLNSPRFPIVSRMAKGILSIQVSTVAFESAFSASCRILDPYRNALAPNIVEALETTKHCKMRWCLDETVINILRFLETKFPAIVYNDALKLEIKSGLNPNVKLDNETSSPKYNCKQYKSKAERKALKKRNEWVKRLTMEARKLRAPRGVEILEFKKNNPNEENQENISDYELMIDDNDFKYMCDYLLSKDAPFFMNEEEEKVEEDKYELVGIPQDRMNTLGEEYDKRVRTNGYISIHEIE
ncbi:zinc finger BED domain-containing protein RICESLEEPER 2 [Tanacetum coccineum]